ncbi:adult-specific rigid cuticular protein 15.7, partial [Nephila pilipes]
ITILFAALAAVHANALLGHGALISTGVSNRAQSRCFRKLAFGYGIKDGLGASNSRSETNEPGTRQCPAALIASPYPGPVALLLTPSSSSRCRCSVALCPGVYGEFLDTVPPSSLLPPQQLSYGGALGLGHGAVWTRLLLQLLHTEVSAAPRPCIRRALGLGLGKALIH